MIICVNLLIDLITPLVGTNLYVICAVGKVRFEDLCKAIPPFLIAEIIALFIITYIPSITLFLPKLMGFY